jgi:hypothetical protein
VSNTALVSSIGGAWQVIFSAFGAIALAGLAIRDKLCPKQAVAN